MRRIFTASLLLTISISIAAGQEGAGRERILAAPAEGPATAAPGIEKKDIRALIVYPENVYSPADVQRMEAAVQGIVDQIASGAKLTKADAARQAGSGPANQAIVQQIEQSLRKNEIVFLEMSLAPASAGNRPITPSGNIIVRNIRKKTLVWDGFVVVVVPPDASPQTGVTLADAAVKMIQAEPWPAGLVIKTKSTPL